MIRCGVLFAFLGFLQDSGTELKRVQVIETESFVNELMGRPKEKESIRQILGNINILSVRSFDCFHRSISFAG